MLRVEEKISLEWKESAQPVCKSLVASSFKVAGSLRLALDSHSGAVTIGFAITTHVLT